MKWQWRPAPIQTYTLNVHSLDVCWSVAVIFLHKIMFIWTFAEIACSRQSYQSILFSEKEMWAFKVNLHTFNQKWLVFCLGFLLYTYFWGWFHCFQGWNAKEKNKVSKLISFLDCAFCKNYLMSAARGIKAVGAERCKGISEFDGEA